MLQVMKLPSPDWTDYALLDSGGGEKLERFGPYTFIRPEPQADWPRKLSWKDNDGVFRVGSDLDTGEWQFRRQIDPRWIMRYKRLKFYAAATPYRHLGVFPEQAAQWDWLG